MKKDLLKLAKSYAPNSKRKGGNHRMGAAEREVLIAYIKGEIDSRQAAYAIYGDEKECSKVRAVASSNLFIMVKEGDVDLVWNIE